MKKKLYFIYFFSFVISIAPILIFVSYNMNHYIREVPAGAFRITVGGAMVGVIVFLKTIGRLKFSLSVRWYIVGAVICYLLQSLLYDLGSILMMAAIGEALDIIFFRHRIEKIKKTMESDELADKIVNKMKGEGEENV